MISGTFCSSATCCRALSLAARNWSYGTCCRDADHAFDGTALDDSLLEQAPGSRSSHHSQHFGTAAGLAENRHIGRIAAESPDVVMYPLQRGYQVHDPPVGGVLVLWSVGRQVQVSEHIQPVIDAHDDDIAELGQPSAIISGQIDGRTR